MRSSTRDSIAGKKKLVIQPFKTQPKLPDNFFEVTWEVLEKAVRAVNTKTAASTGKEELYRAVEDLCLHKLSNKIYEKLRIECEAYINEKVDSLCGHSSDHWLFLELCDNIWRDHCEHMITIRNIFLYLDRSYAVQTPGVLPLWDMGLSLYRARLKTRPDVEMSAVIAILAVINEERLGCAVDRGLLRRILRMFSTLEIYRESFEVPYIEDSRRFFTNEGNRIVENMDAAQFLAHVEHRLNQANDMVASYLDVATKHPLIESIETCLLAPHAIHIVEKGAPLLLEENRQSDLKRMIQLLERVNCTESLRVVWNSFIRLVGGGIVSDEQKDKTMVEELLAFMDRLDDILRNAFSMQDIFKTSMKSAMEHVVSSRPRAPAELLAKFVDKKMRGERGVSDTEVEAVLDKVMTLFQRLQAKDMFEAFYKKSLAKRLLLGKSANYDLEKSMLSKLKTECGANFTGKMEGMFADVELSKGVMNQFSVWAQSAPNTVTAVPPTGSPRSLEASYQVLTTGFWPSYPTLEVTVPAEIQAHQDQFSQYYASKYQGRRLLWQHSLGRCVVIGRFPKGRKELELSFFQTIILLCFNKHDRLSLTQIKEYTKLEGGELTRTLQSLACGVIGLRVLTKSPKGKDVADTDEFSYNSDFTNKLFRIKINTIQLKDTVEEAEKTHDEVFRDRQYQVDAAIVRIMKARKQLTHNTLMAELMSQLRFPVRPADLKKRIESLIEREFLDRHREESSTYIYLA